ncbi:MAG TPA: response regulator [Acidobacteriaceae bacterium]|jgi:CheY-like chemotaxis protein
MLKGDSVLPAGGALSDKGSVLVVDDEPDLLEIAVLFLRDKGYNAMGALDGATALAVLQERPDIGLLITDVTMPGMNGIELAEKARLLNPLLAVVYCSGHYADALLRQYASIGEGSVLHKPYEWKDFFTAVQRSMPRKKIADC